MITGLSIVTVWVLDCDSAKKFYTEQLGFTLTNDIELESGMRWLTVRPPGRENQELLLLDPLHSMLDEDSAQQVRALIAKGALSPGVMATSDCKGDHATLAERGVEFIQEPAERPYGVEALLRDDWGSVFVSGQGPGAARLVRPAASAGDPPIRRYGGRSPPSRAVSRS